MFDAAVAHVRALRERGLNVIVAGWSDGSRERLSHVLAEHGLKPLEFVSSYHQATTTRVGALPLTTPLADVPPAANITCRPGWAYRG